MANRKLLFVNVDAAGFIYNDYELTASDDVDLQGAAVINAKDPVNNQDLVTLAYLNAHTPSADNVDVQRTADATGISQYQAVYYSGNDIISAADSSDIQKVSVVGLAPVAIAGSTSGVIRKSGVLVGCLTGATAGRPYFLGHAGLPVLNTALVPGDRIIMLGFAKNATDLEICIDIQNKK